jgi:hypothetical protein
MDKCEQCGEEVLLPFRCSYCKSYFCLNHHLPESHICPNIPQRAPLGSSQTKKETAIAHAEQKTQSKNPIAEKRELPTFRFNKNSKKKTTLRFTKRRRNN